MSGRGPYCVPSCCYLCIFAATWGQLLFAAPCTCSNAAPSALHRTTPAAGLVYKHFGREIVAAAMELPADHADVEVRSCEGDGDSLLHRPGEGDSGLLPFGQDASRAAVSLVPWRSAQVLLPNRSPARPLVPLLPYSSSCLLC